MEFSNKTEQQERIPLFLSDFWQNGLNGACHQLEWLPFSVHMHLPLDSFAHPYFIWKTNEWMTWMNEWLNTAGYLYAITLDDMFMINLTNVWEYLSVCINSSELVTIFFLQKYRKELIWLYKISS